MSLSNDQTNEYATRQVLSFIRLGESGAPSKRAWSINLLPEAGPFNWDNLDIYDIKGRLLFKDKMLSLVGGLQIRMRMAATTILGAPTWSAGVGPTFDISRAIQKAEQLAADHDLTPVAGAQALVCYSYPKLGLLCSKNNSIEKVVIDLGDFIIIPTNAGANAGTPESIICWSPFDLITNATIGALNESWSIAIAALPEMPSGTSNLTRAIASAQASVEEKTLELKLHGQETSVYCAVATGQMLLEYYGIAKTQKEIATAMKTSSTGSENPDQLAAYRSLTGGTLDPLFDDKPSYEGAKSEIQQARPLKSGISGHARACAGYKVDNDQWLYIYDPWPVGQGAIYYENWNDKNLIHTNFITLKRILYT